MEGHEVVVSGISCRLPGCDNMAEFRQHLIDGTDMTSAGGYTFEDQEYGNGVLMLFI